MLGDKFGCDFETEAIDLLEEAAALNLKVNCVCIFYYNLNISTTESN